jgi:hypothetical protein
MKLGKVGINYSYVVDLENETMVDEAKDCVYEDIMNAFKYNELGNHIGIIENKDQLSEEDIPEFLKDQERC